MMPPVPPLIRAVETFAGYSVPVLTSDPDPDPTPPPTPVPPPAPALYTADNTDAISRARLRQSAAQLRATNDIPVVHSSEGQPIGHILTVEAAIPTQVAHPMRAAIRTSVQTGVALLCGFAGLWPGLSPIFSSLFSSAGLPTPVYFSAVLVGVSAMAGAVSRLMAVPEVDTWLERVRLGASPPG